MIERVKQELAQKAAVTKTRDKLKVAASIGRLFEKRKIEKFFAWHVGDNGELTWSLKDEIVKQEEQLDGCYIIRTDVQKEQFKQLEVVEMYRNLQKVEQAFKNLKTVMLELRPMYHKTDERLKSHIFMASLAYYIQWHATQRLKPLFEADGEYADKRWTFEIVVERLKSIRLTETLIGGVVVKNCVSKPDEEQQKILELLKVKLT